MRGYNHYYMHPIEGKTPTTRAGAEKQQRDFGYTTVAEQKSFMESTTAMVGYAIVSAALLTTAAINTFYDPSEGVFEHGRPSIESNLEAQHTEVVRR